MKNKRRCIGASLFSCTAVRPTKPNDILALLAIAIALPEIGVEYDEHELNSIPIPECSECLVPN